MSKKYLPLIFILALGLFFRVYKLETFYPFAHDQDLYSFIVKDILVDHHLRLIGQLTSIDGVFIGPLFYYLLVPFYALFNLNPLAATLPATLISLLTIFSTYLTLTKLFSKKTGLIGSFIYAVSFSSAFYDRWVVPTLPSTLWSVWFLYAIVSLSRGEEHSLIILAILFGLVWHIHIALMPLILLVPLALIFSKKTPKIKTIFTSVLFFSVLMIPFFLFEIRHGFGQVHGLVASFSQERGEIRGFPRLVKVFNFTFEILISPLNLGFALPSLWGFLAGISLTLYLILKKALDKKTLLILGGWILVVFLSQFVSKRATSEYYFSSLPVIFILLVSLFLEKAFTRSKFLLVLGAVFLALNLIRLLTFPEPENGYIHQKEVANYISSDAANKNYPCVSINYIAGPGQAVGFRYLLYLKNLKTIKPGTGAPVYSLVIPYTTSKNEINARFGSYGVILPVNPKPTQDSVCSDPKNQLEPLLGFDN